VSSNQPHQALYRRWRAQTFDRIVGQTAVVETLRNAVRSGRVSHAYLFIGPRGTGKTSMARILAKAINCTDLRDGEPCDACPSCVAIRDGRALDVTEMDAASNNRVDDMRELLGKVFTAPSDLKRKVYIIDEVQRITQGWDVLLKTLEEPPDHVVFIFCTTEPGAIRPAVMSRVQHFDFRKLTVPEIAGKLRTIMAEDGRPAEPEAIDLIARLAAGGMRDAESMLDQLLSVDMGTLAADRVREVLGLVDEETIDRFLRSMLGGDALAGIELLDDLENHGRDLKAFTDHAVEGARAALLASMGRGTPSGLGAAGPAVLADITRRLAAIDTGHPGPGGLRLQLELALLAPHFGSGGVERGAVPRPASFTAPPPQAATARPMPAPVVKDHARPAATAEPPAPAATPVTHTTAAEPARTAAPPGPAPGSRPQRPGEPSGPGRSQQQPSRSAAAGGSPPPATRPSEPKPARSLEPPSSRPPEPPRAEAPRTGAGPKPTLELVLQRWPEIVAVIGHSPAVKPLILDCRPIGVDGAVITLGFPETKSFLKEVAERRRPMLEDGFAKVLGMPVNVRCVPANVESGNLTSDPDGNRMLTEFNRIFGDDAVDVRDVD
jgi:DNA polymerase III subunit gamma/tau